MFDFIKRTKQRKKDKKAQEYLKNDWVLVQVEEATVQWTNRGDETNTIFFYLYENGLGERKIEHKAEGYAGQTGYGKQHSYYLRYILPWLKGKDEKNIPSYGDIKKNNNEQYVQELYRRLAR